MRAYARERVFGVYIYARILVKNVKYVRGHVRVHLQNTFYTRKVKHTQQHHTFTYAYSSTLFYTYEHKIQLLMYTYRA